MMQSGSIKTEISDDPSVAASIVNQPSVEELLKNHVKGSTLARLRSNGINEEMVLLSTTENQLEHMGIGVVERKKILARSDFLRRQHKRMSIVKERIPKGSCVNSHRRASQLFADYIATPRPSRLSHSIYEPALLPLIRNHISKESSNFLTSKKPEDTADETTYDTVDGKTNDTVNDIADYTADDTADEMTDEMTEETAGEPKQVNIDSNKACTSPPVSLQHIASSLRLMPVWHAYYILELDTDEQNGVSMNDLHTLANKVSTCWSDKETMNVDEDIDRASKNSTTVSFSRFQTLLVNKYSTNPLAIVTEDLEKVVWDDYYRTFISKDITAIGILTNTCYTMWQVFNRLADENYYPTALPKLDLLKILEKCSKFFRRPHYKKNDLLEREEVFQFPYFLRILCNEAYGEMLYNDNNPAQELAKELHNIFVVEEIRAGILYKKANGFAWHKRYFIVVPFEIRWFMNSDKKGKSKSISLDQHTGLVCSDNKLFVTNGKNTVKLKAKDIKSIATWKKAIDLVRKVHSTCLTPRQSQLLQRRHGEHLTINDKMIQTSIQV